MRDLLGYFTGRVELEAKGNQIEQFINLLHRYRIPARRLRAGEEGFLYFTLPKQSFKRLRTPAFKTGTRVRILKKRGLFMMVRPFRKRYGFAAGALLFLGLILYCSCFIWRVEVVGCENASELQIREDLAEFGIKAGSRRNMDVGKIENLYLIGNEKLSWIAVNIRGTTAYIEVKEKDLTPKVEDLSVPTNIYAERDGVILSIYDYRGTRMVEKGDTVRAGDLLVSGDWTDSYGVRRLSHCVAKITARTTRETEFLVPLTEKIRQKSGKKMDFYEIFLGKLKIPLYFSKKISYNDYNTIEEEKILRIGSFAFPIKILKISIEEMEEKPVLRTEEQAYEEAKRQCAFYRKDRLAEVKVLDCKMQKTLRDDILRLQAEFICEEKIGIEKEIEE